MRITKVSVKKLFGVFDHEIPLNQDSRITIMHGPNGFGKTILLTMLNGLFNSSYRVFKEVPFEEFRVYLDHQEYLVLSEENDALMLSFTNVTGSYTVNLLEDSDGDPDWLSEIRRGIDVDLIKTQRLQTEVAIEPDSKTLDDFDDTRAQGLAVEEYSAKTASLVHNVSGARKLSESQLKDLDEILEGLSYILEVEESKESPDYSEFEQRMAYVRSLRELIEFRLDYSEQMSRRLATLVELLNGHFSFKTVYTDAKSGLVILSPDGKLVPVASLSSGEQHQLVLFSKLLFEVPTNSLVLIDEPELSLHVTWQHEFLNDLKRVIDLCDFDVLIATHSPQIVHDKWDWMVDLHNPEADYSDDVAEYA